MSDTCVNHIENYWKFLTEEANKFFEEGNNELALDGYLNALYRAEVLNSNLPDCVQLKVPFIQVYTISCYNLANCYQEVKDLNRAEEILQKAIYFLLHFYQKDYQKEIIEKELRKSILNYLSFTQKSNVRTSKTDAFLTYLKNQTTKNNLQNIKTFDYVQFN
ncbi:tetratricopeptide repeat protein [Capnocytophaga cynodegmi]|uniref:Tetratricopeptide repeat protein n=1 Tax=Capnocytophaga cynodegmi TaxID=28189 RepID=A0A0B7HNM7_9FLAO|nr:tetratricopeptide repeat protein [Capnocytophaga cynodegmi]CEN41336.1 conserved hypothetical protein [Capnocytophaga cynodegmi]